MMALSEITPPPEDFQKWCDELYAELPDLPDPIEDSLKAKYDLRMEVREKFNVPITFLDQDESGTFDPAGRKPQKCTPINSKKRERRQLAGDGTPKRLKGNTWRRGRWMGCQLPIVLKLTSEAGRKALKDFGTSLDNHPERFRDLNILDDSQLEWREFHAQPYGLRERRRCDISDFTITASNDDLNLEDITLGHPAYRGCRECFELGVRCPLLDEGSRYPCAECVADNIECNLILQPAVKRTCEGCRNRRQHCSYKEEGSDHANPCQQCAISSRKCVAGPASGRTRTGPSLDQGAPQAVRKQIAQARKLRAHPRMEVAESKTSNVTCIQCPQDEKWCSRIRHGERAECDYCCDRSSLTTARTPGHQCTFSNKGEGKKKEPEIYNQSTDKPTDVESTEIDRRRTITTKLAHPIQFNYAYDDEGVAPCHWCNDAIYGILGLGEVEVEVIEIEDGQGFMEISGGHTEIYGHSRMCQFCTADRLKITACENHEIEPIEGIDPETFDYETVVEWMMPGMALLAPFAWCSICPSPAFYRCSTKPIIDLDGQEGDIYAGDEKGCGLLLCYSCAVILVNEHDGKLDKLIDSLEDGDHGRFGIRADANFLHLNGELMRRVRAY